MRTTDLEKLLTTVEAVRMESNPDLDAEFLRAVILAEQRNQEDESEAIRVIREELEKAVARRGSRASTQAS